MLKRVSQPSGTAPYPMVDVRGRDARRFQRRAHSDCAPTSAHTDGDAIVYFEQAHVLHMGDTFFFGMFPAVYREGGGDIKGLIAAIEHVVAEFPADTRVIPDTARWRR